MLSGLNVFSPCVGYCWQNEIRLCEILFVRHWIYVTTHIDSVVVYSRNISIRIKKLVRQYVLSWTLYIELFVLSLPHSQKLTQIFKFSILNNIIDTFGNTHMSTTINYMKFVHSVEAIESKLHENKNNSFLNLLKSYIWFLNNILRLIWNQNWIK